MIAVKAGETFILEQEVFFDGHKYGSNTPIPSGQIKIRRDTDGKFWDGAAFVVTEAYLATTISGDGLYHSYSFVFPAGDDIGYTINIRVHNDTDTEVVNNYMTRSMDKLLRNKRVLDAVTGIETIYNDDGTVMYTRQVYEDAAGAQTYRDQGADRVERYT